jgi:uncharacterized alkaline shock family protein YloU
VSGVAAADPAERGRLDILPVVLRKIAEHAADTTPGTLRHERRVAGIEMGSAGSSARVTEADSGSVDVALELTLSYPGSVRDTVEAVREAVHTDLTRLAGRRVRNLAVTVSGLRSPGSGTDAGHRSRVR